MLQLQQERPQVRALTLQEKERRVRKRLLLQLRPELMKWCPSAVTAEGWLWWEQLLEEIPAQAPKQEFHRRFRTAPGWRTSCVQHQRWLHILRHREHREHILLCPYHRGRTIGWSSKSDRHSWKPHDPRGPTYGQPIHRILWCVKQKTDDAGLNEWLKLQE